MYQSKKYLGHEGVIYPSRVSTKSLLPSIFELKLFFYEQYCITISVLRSIQYPTGLNITNSKTKIIPDHVITVQHYTSYTQLHEQHNSVRLLALTDCSCAGHGHSCQN